MHNAKHCLYKSTFVLNTLKIFKEEQKQLY